MHDHNDDLPFRADANLLPEQAAAFMRLWLPVGPYPGAPESGPALSARTRRGTGPPSFGGFGERQRYVETEIANWCINLYPAAVRLWLRAAMGQEVFCQVNTDQPLFPCAEDFPGPVYLAQAHRLVRPPGDPDLVVLTIKDRPPEDFRHG